jgi:lipopolysaccharide/colanic/teichoic acid biosynthesis glycosyltransferase
MTTQTIKSTGLKADEPTSRFSLRAWMGKAVKRGFDIVLSGLGLLILSPIFLLIAILIKRDSPGPVFYRGRRAGQYGKEFTILKFRSMYERPESYQGEKITAQDDPRITPVGKWLRQAKLNELPQLWNVLKGEMSLVGPRPEDPEIVATWPEELRKEVLSVRPGITSPASVMFRDEEQQLGNGAVMVGQSPTIMDKYLGEILPSKLRLDQIYVHSLPLDLLRMTGVVGFTAVAILLLAWFHKVRKTCRKIGDGERATYEGIVVFRLIILVMSSYGETLRYSPAGYLFWAALGIEAAFAWHANKQSNFEVGNAK